MEALHGAYMKAGPGGRLCPPYVLEPLPDDGMHHLAHLGQEYVQRAMTCHVYQA